MYVMNDNFFDGFPVLFGNGETIINKAHYPLGSFAVEFLNLDTGVLRAINKQIPILKEAMTVFLSARDATSAAEAQQEINTLWNNLMKLPVYKLFEREEMSHQHLIQYMREHPDETDDMITLGTERNKMYVAWLAKLERLTESLNVFTRNTNFMLEEYFSDLKERTASAYAMAFGTYRAVARSAFKIAQEEREESGSLEPIEHIEIEFPTIVSFESVWHPKKKDVAVLAERMLFEELSSFLYIELYRGLAAGHVPRRCDNCGKWFLLNSGYDIRYCTRIAPGEQSRTCRQVGAHRKEKARNGTEFVRREYRRVYNRLKQRKNRGVITVDEWNSQVAQAQELRDMAARGELNDAELKLRFEKM